MDRNAPYWSAELNLGLTAFEWFCSYAYCIRDTILSRTGLSMHFCNFLLLVLGEGDLRPRLFWPCKTRCYWGCNEIMRVWDANFCVLLLEMKGFFLNLNICFTCKEAANATLWFSGISISLYKNRISSLGSRILGRLYFQLEETFGDVKWNNENHNKMSFQ